ncbi:DUF1746-domain-containing protein [Xylaria palmicola]|nr:DUF1746-domain-containing protein [Xylaria palmicola]
MNHDLSPTLPADRPSLPTQHHEADVEIQGNPRPPAPERQQHGSAGVQSASLSPSAKEGLEKKLAFLAHLCFNLDALAYAELCILYYMDCSFFRLFIRWIAQTLFVSPKNDDTVLIVPNYHVSAIVAPNLLCIFLHLISSPPEASEATRGYLHGGVLVDFIGQTAPSSRFTLILLDAAVLAIQCFMITVNMEKERLRNVIKPPRVNVTSGIAVAPVTSQDYDSEERGVLRDGPDIDQRDETDDVEMRSLGNYNDGGVSNSGSTSGEGNRLLGQPGQQRTNNRFEGLAAVLQSGNAVVGNFHIPQSLRTAWTSRESTPESAAAYALQNVGYNATLAALAAQRRARLNATQPRQP